MWRKPKPNRLVRTAETPSVPMPPPVIRQKVTSLPAHLIPKWSEEEKKDWAAFFGEAYIPPSTSLPEPAIFALQYPEPSETEPVFWDDPEERLQAGLERLRDEIVWSAAEAKRILGALEPLAEADLITVAVSTVGRLVCLGREGRRQMSMNPHVVFPVERLENLLYFRLACAHYGWVTVREPYLGAARSVGKLERLAVVLEGGQKRYVMARSTADGYQSAAVAKMFTLIRSTLLADGAVLVVVTPNLSKLGRMQSRRGLLKVVEFRGKR